MTRFGFCAILATAALWHVAGQPPQAVGADAGATAKANDATSDASSLIEAVNLLPEKYRPDAVKALSVAEKNQGEMLKAIKQTPAEHREAIAFLIAHMPPDDLTSLKADFLLENVDYAYRGRAAVAWGKDLPDELFFNYVLPYANLNERRDNWRKDFFDKFLPLVKDCKTPGEAAVVLNKDVFPKLNVKYHATKRPKPDQSPYESTAAGYASCTGLSIMLADACRALCVPARAVGTQWTKVAGNHTWVEVWDRQWNFVGACEPAKLNQTWFFGNASQADPAQLEHRIFAASYARTGHYFPLVWRPDDKDVPGVDVTAFYTHRDTIKVKVLDKPEGKPQPARVEIHRDGELVAGGSGESSYEFDIARGEKYTIEVSPPRGKTATRQYEFPADKDKGNDLTVYTAGDR